MRVGRVGLVGLLALGSGLACAAPPPVAGVRAPAVAGRFYPEEPSRLEAAVKGFLADALPPRGERPIALVAPHAGYVFSGQIAADAYRQATDYPIEVVVLLGTNHTSSTLAGVSVFQGAGYRTPLGVAAVDQAIARTLLAAGGDVTFQPEAHTREHSEEVQVPFVQVAFPQAHIVPVVIGRPDPGVAARFGRELARALSGRQALIVASSDLSHYPESADAAAVDRQTLMAIAGLDGDRLAILLERQLREDHPNLSTCACGAGPILVAMAAARELGARRGVVISYANSGQTVFGEPDRAVGYGAVVFTAGSGPTDVAALEPTSDGSTAGLSAADGQYLCGLARRTLERFLTSETVPLPRAANPALNARQGAFVTLNERGSLRGCIGHMAEDTPVALTVARMAVQAAFRDPRFPPVRHEELPELEVEVSVLTPAAPVRGPEEIVVGRDGATLDKDGHRAVFLPQVAPEQGWSRDEMLAHLCRKAELPEDCWQRGARFATFQAQVFREDRSH